MHHFSAPNTPEQINWSFFQFLNLILIFLDVVFGSPSAYVMPSAVMYGPGRAPILHRAHECWRRFVATRAYRSGCGISRDITAFQCAPK